jgi:pseudouridine-5'-phosphate glycosidase/pseudouridine kinase
MFQEFHSRGLFDTEFWFPIIDALRLDQTFRNSLQHLEVTNADVGDLYTSGLAQQVIHMLPFIPNLFIKDGSKGVISFQLLHNVSSIKKSLPRKMITSSGKAVTLAVFEGFNDIGILLQHVPAHFVDSAEVVSVTGAGDTFCGVLLSELSSWPASRVEYSRAIDKAQLAATHSLRSPEAVNPTIKSL